MKYILFILLPLIPFISNCAHHKKKHKKVIIKKEYKIIEHKPNGKEIYKEKKNLDVPKKKSKPEKSHPDPKRPEDEEWWPFQCK